MELLPGGVGAFARDADITAVNHICLAAESVDEAVAALRKLGVVLTTKPNLGVDGNGQSWLEDPDGNPIVLIQMVLVNMREIAIV
jgi:hypothetical protein